MIKNYGPKNPPPGRNLGPKFPPHVGRSPKKIWKQFRPYIKMSMYRTTKVTSITVTTTRVTRMTTSPATSARAYAVIKYEMM